MFKVPTTAAKHAGRGARTPILESAPQRKHRPGEKRENPAAALQRTVGNQAVLRMLGRNSASSHAPRPVQAELAIDAPGDRFEQEADRVAEQVGRAPSSGAAPSAVASSVPGLQRKCDCGGTCSKCRTQSDHEHAHEQVQLKRIDATSGAGPTAAPPIVDDMLRTPGQSLDSATRAYMEPRFGHDFSQVRVHTDAPAAVSAKELHARAYTVGSHVAFAGNQFSPATTEGRKLLAHELTHVVQQRGGATAIQRAPDKDDDDDDEAAARPARARSCPGGAMPYNGVCLTDEILEALPATGDVHAAVRVVKAHAEEKKAQGAVEKKYAKVPDAALSKKIDDVREAAAGQDSAPALLGRLEKERSRRRAEPISTPTTVDQAIAMLEEAWSLDEKEQPPDHRRAFHLVHVVNSWLQKAADVSGYDKFSGFSKTTAMTTVGMAKGNVADLESKFRFGSSIGGWWPATINSLKMARELIQIMSGEKRMEETEFNAINKTIHTTTWATPLVGTAIMAAPVLIVAVPEIPALPATIAGVNTAVWGQTLFAAGLSASYLSHVVTRSKEAAETKGGVNPLSIAFAAMGDALGPSQVVQSATNQSILTGKDLDLSNTERAVGAFTGTVETVLNFLGAKDVMEGIPGFEPPPRVRARPNVGARPPEDFPFGGGRQPLPKPESPNKVYRTMSMDEAAQSLQTGKLPPPIRGAEGERFVSLDSDYAMQFREKEIADIEVKFGKQVSNAEDSLKSIEDRLAQLKAEKTPNEEAISKLTAQREKFLAAQKQRGLANKAEAEPIIKEWHEAPGQQVVVEIELEPGALDDMLGRSVDHAQGNWGNYSSSGEDVYLWKLERGYGRNIGIPKWQLDAFNGSIRGIRLYAYRGMKLLGGTKAPLGNN